MVYSAAYNSLQARPRNMNYHCCSSASWKSWALLAPWTPPSSPGEGWKGPRIENSNKNIKEPQPWREKINRLFENYANYRSAVRQSSLSMTMRRTTLPSYCWRKVLSASIPPSSFNPRGNKCRKKSFWASPSWAPWPLGSLGPFWPLGPLAPLGRSGPLAVWGHKLLAPWRLNRTIPVGRNVTKSFWPLLAPWALWAFWCYEIVIL